MPKKSGKSGKKLTPIQVKPKTIKKAAEDLSNRRLSAKTKSPAGVVIRALKKKKKVPVTKKTTK